MTVELERGTESASLNAKASLERAGAEDAAAVLQQIRSGEITSVIVGGCDTNGVLRGKRVSSERFIAGAQPAFEISELLWVLDIADAGLVPRPAGYDGWWPEWATGFGDMVALADLGTLRRVPWLERTALVLSDYRFTDGRSCDIAPRNVLRRVLERYQAVGLEPRFACEYEFVVFRESEESASKKGYRDLQPLAPSMPYWTLRTTLDDHVIGRIIEALAAMRIHVQAWNPEGLAGQWELNLPHAPALEAADLAFLFKHSVKELCALDGLTATFMPKLAGIGPGSSLHVHQSLWRDGTSAFYEAPGGDGMSPLMRHFVAGQLEMLVPFTAIWRPTPTAFKRAVPHVGAGTTKTWGADNKTLSLRVLTRDPGSCRVEHRVPGADSNVYLALAAMLASGLYGIENELELPSPTTGDAFANSELELLPRNLDTAIELFEQDPIANDYLGEQFVHYYAATRRWEAKQAETAVTDLELKRYFTRI